MDREQLMKDATAALLKQEETIKQLRQRIAELESEVAKDRGKQSGDLGDAIAKVLDPVARQVSKSRGRVVTAEEVRKASEGAGGEVLHDPTYRIRAKRLARIAELEKRR